MCRFLLLQSRDPVQMQPVVDAFAEAVKNSYSYDGDWQGDGWGTCWIDENNEWKLYKSLQPIWESVRAEPCVRPQRHRGSHCRGTGSMPSKAQSYEGEAIHLAPETTRMLIHARSASFEKDKDNIDFNQPFLNSEYAFVFNGLLKGVRLPFPVEGTIGSQKIWSLLNNSLTCNNPLSALNGLKEFLQTHSREIQALNIGIANKNNLYYLSVFNAYPAYYQLKLHNLDTLTIISSEAIEGYHFQQLPQGIYEI